MSVGLSLLAALIAEQDRTGFREVREEYFTRDEQPAWVFVRDYYHNFGDFPTFEVLAENSVMLTAATGTVGYHIDRAQRRAVYNVIQNNQAPLTQALDARDMDRAIAALDAMLVGAGRIRTSGGVATLQEWAGRVMEEYQTAQTQDNQGTTLGWEPLDRATGGVFPGDVCVVVGRTGVGKSYTISHMAMAAWRSGKRVLFVTMEMTDAQIATRLVGLEARTDPRYIRAGTLSHHAFPAFQRSVDRLSQDDAAQFHLVGGAVQDTVNTVDALVQDVRPDVVYIDASYLLRPPEGVGRGRARWELLANVNEGLKRMALARHVGLVHTVQFNRKERARGKNDPDTADVAGTDVVTHLATTVISVRPGVSPYERTRRRMYVTKSREGPTGDKFTINYLFQPIDFSVMPDQADNDPQAQERQIQNMQQLQGNMI